MEKKPKILLVSRNLMAGGVESSSINFIENMRDSLDIDAFFCNFDGILKSKFPTNITVHKSNKYLQFFSGADSSVSQIGQRSKLKTLIRNIVKFFFKKLGIKKFFKFLAVKKVKISNEYDCVLSFFAQNDLCSKVSINRVKAKQKFAFIHTDVGVNPISKEAFKLLFKYDKILCVSQSSANIFKKTYPELAEKTDFIYNFQDNNKIMQHSSDFTVNYPKTFNIITVARLSDDEKAFFRSLKIFKQLKDEGYDFNWHIVGDGVDKVKMENYIKTNNMSNYVTLHGNQANPYPYIKSSDLFFLGSRHESWGIVIIEALILGVPVLTTNTCSAYEILGDKCFICENKENFIYEKLKFVLDNKHLLNIEKEKIKNYLFDNESNKLRFLRILNEKVSNCGK